MCWEIPEGVREDFLKEVEKEQTSERPTDPVLNSKLSFWDRHQDSGLVAPDWGWHRFCAHF